MYAFRNVTLDTKDYNDEEFMNLREPIYIKDVGYRIKFLILKKIAVWTHWLKKNFIFQMLMMLFYFALVL
jgi:hypothetical protein